MDRKEFLRRVEACILENYMLKKGDRVILGISGGADSVCLFSVFLEYREKYELSLMAVHVNHKLRGEDSEGDEEFVRELCRKHGVEFRSFFADVGKMAADERLSVEEAGRLLRYRFFEEAAKEWKADRIAVAHHENDQAETVLFNLFRGSSLRGLTGMSPVNGKIIRPLLCVGRKDIEDYIEQTGLSFRTDKSNFSTEYKRNFIRNEIIPLAKNHVNERAVSHTARLAGELLETEEYMESVADLAYRECCRKVDGDISIDIPDFMERPQVIQRRVLLNALSAMAGSRKDISFVNIGLLLKLFFAENGKSTDLPYGLRAIREYDRVRIMKRDDKENEEFIFPIELSELGTKKDILTVRLPYGIVPKKKSGENLGQKADYFGFLRLSIIEKKEKIINIPKNDYTKWFDCDKISKSVFLRSRRRGDYMEIDSMAHKKKLKEILINGKYPVSMRNQLPLLADGSHIIWILGGRISEAYKVTEQTKRVLVCELTGGT